jgi:hypothetical protein
VAEYVDKKNSLRGERRNKWKRKERGRWISKEECEAERKIMVQNKKKQTIK